MDSPVGHCVYTTTSSFHFFGRFFGRFSGRNIFVAVSVSILAMVLAVSVSATTPQALADLSLEELAMLPVTSVSKTAKPVSSAPASVFVITERAIRRSGATTLPEALRIAPNLQVARVNAGSYAISARGFNSPFSNKLLAMIDGRTIYTPLFSGVFWDAQDVMLEDLDRVEVVSGPGGTMWGANAVNGVINVVSRSAAETQGTLISIGGSSIEQHGAARYGSSWGEQGYYRVYVKHGEHDNSQTADGITVPSGWERSQTGFRVDWGNSTAKYTLQGDAYRGRVRNTYPEDVELSGANVLGRAAWALSSRSTVTVQAYFDHTQRLQPKAFAQHLNAFDLELQHEWLASDKHKIVWGGGYRHLTDDVDNDLAFAFLPEQLTMQWRNVFLQDEITLSDDVKLILGSKWEDNPFTRWETMPSAQLAWEPDSTKLVWASIARAVRAPSRIDRDVHSPGNPPIIGGKPLYFISGGPDFVAEVANVFELGYRSQPIAKVSWSVTGFYSEYDKLRTLEPVENGFGYQFRNEAEASVHGLELWGGWQATPKWRFNSGMVAQDTDKTRKPGSADISDNTGLTTDDPHFYGYLSSSYDVSDHVRIDATLRRVSELTHIEVPAYTTLNVRLAWTIAPGLELSLVGQNLLENSHPEFGNVLGRSEHERAFYGKLVWGL